MKLNLKHYLIIIIAGLVVFLPSMILGVGTTHDTLLHATWTKGFIAAIESGNFIPRWLGDSFNGLGSATFYLYPPFVYYLSALLESLTHSHLFTILAQTNMLMVILSGLAFYLLAKRMVKVEYALIGALLYMFAPYHFTIDINIRGAFAETATFIWYPLIFLAIERNKHLLFDSAFLAFSLAGLLLSHTISFLLFLPFWLGYLYQHHHRTSRYPQLALRIVLPLFLALTMTSFYWATMLTYLGEVHATFWHDTADLIANSFVGNFAKYAVGSAKFAFAIDMSWLILASTLALVFIAIKANKIITSKAYCLILLSLIGLFLVSILSSFLWHLFPFTQKIQFTWRILSIVEFLVVLNLTLHFQIVISFFNKSRKFKFITLSLMCVSLGLTLAIFIRSVILLPLNESERAIQHQALARDHGAIEYIPKYSSNTSRTALEALSPELAFSYDQNISSVNIEKNDQGFLVDIQSKGTDRLVLRQFYFPNWQGKEINTGENLSLFPSTKEGLLSFEIKPGEYKYHIFIKPSSVEFYSLLLSIIGLVISLTFAITTRDKK